jgi:hypothetical protein
MACKNLTIAPVIGPDYWVSRFWKTGLTINSAWMQRGHTSRPSQKSSNNTDGQASVLGKLLLESDGTVVTLDIDSSGHRAFHNVALMTKVLIKIRKYCVILYCKSHPDHELHDCLLFTTSFQHWHPFGALEHKV